MGRTLLVLLVLIGCSGLLACGLAGPTATPQPPTASPTEVATATPVPTPTPTFCSTSDGRKVYDLLSAFSQEWDDALKLADSTPRSSLAPQIQRLQEIRRKVQAQSWPGCAQSAYDALLLMMNQFIDGYIGFLGQRTGYLVTFDQANRSYTAFLAELERVTR